MSFIADPISAFVAQQGRPDDLALAAAPTRPEFNDNLGKQRMKIFE